MDCATVTTQIAEVSTHASVRRRPARSARGKCTSTVSTHASVRRRRFVVFDEVAVVGVSTHASVRRRLPRWTPCRRMRKFQLTPP